MMRALLFSFFFSLFLRFLDVGTLLVSILKHMRITHVLVWTPSGDNQKHDFQFFLFTCFSTLVHLNLMQLI
jgi:hypothetical protein